MKALEAILTCQAWFRYLDKQRDHTMRMAEAAKIARQGNTELAKKMKQQIDREKGLRVYDAAELEPAVRVLVNIAIEATSE
jgi:hypothetical protein